MDTRPLNGLRGIAALWVVITHAIFLLEVGYIASKPAVWLFFALSSFLLTRQLLQADWNIPAYWSRRIFRIAPLFLAIQGLALFGIIMYADGEPEFMRFDGVLWSIAVEEQFYFVLPILAWLMLKAGTTGRVAVLLGAVSLLALIPGHKLALHPYLPIFAAGAFAAWLEREGISFQVGPLMIAAWLALVAIAPFNVWAYAPVCALLILDPPKWMAHPILAYLGKISFGVYVMHMGAIRLALHLDLSPAVGVLFVLAASVILGTASYYLLERHCIALGRRLFVPRPQPVPA